MKRYLERQLFDYKNKNAGSISLAEYMVMENLDDAVKDIKRTTEEFASFYNRLELREQIQNEITRKLHVYFKEYNLIDCFDDMSTDLCQIVVDNFNKYELESDKKINLDIRYELESDNAEEELK
jgi:hypothetical protein